MKRCHQCGAEKEATEFYIGQSGPCKACRIANAKARYREKRAHCLAVANDYYRRTRPEFIAKQRKHTRLRAERVKRATPPWATPFFIAEARDLARRRTQALGFAWHTDHIIPIQSAIVCGLHCEQNIRVIPAHENHAKDNSVWPDMP